MAKIKAQDKPGRPDYFILILVALLVAIGLQTVYSATLGLSLAEYNHPNYYVIRQGAWAAIGTLVLLGAMFFNYRWLRPISLLLLGVSIAALLATMHPAFGTTINGATRWLQLGPLPAIQPSEFAKLALIIYLSAWLASQRDKIGNFTHSIIPFVLIVGIIGGLVMAQPDMGTTIIITLTAATLLFLAGASLKHIFMLGGTGLAAGILLIRSESYRLDRLFSFFNFGTDPLGNDFQVTQSLIAIGKGGVFGAGPGSSVLKYTIPDIHTDSIFAVIGEEMGFIGAIATIIIIGLLVYKGFLLASQSNDAFASLLAAGISSWIAYQALLNIGGITRSIPLTGITLPFISFGGSSLIVFMAAIGIILNISRYHKEKKLKQRPRASVSG